MDLRTVVIEFDSVASAIAAYDSPLHTRPHGSCWAMRLCEISASSKARSSVALCTSMVPASRQR
jgi:hypothetical protein